MAEVADGEMAEPGAAAQEVEDLTPDVAVVKEAGEALKHLFGLMGVKRIISVDDAYEGEIGDLLALAHRMADAGADVDDFAGYFNLTTPEEVWRSEIEQAWSESADEERRLLMAAARRQSGERDGAEHQLDVSHLQPLLEPSGVSLEAVPPGEWPRVMKSVVKTADSTPTLVLLDQEMGDRGDEGIRCAEELFREDAHDAVYVGLLTRKVAKDEEAEHWKKLTSRHRRLRADRFVVISKEHLGPDPRTFPDAIKVVLMSRPAATFKAAVMKSVRDAIESAGEDLDGVTPHDFQRMIIQSSLQEGVWEAESLLRVFQLMMSGHVRDELYNKDIVKDSAAELRQLFMYDKAEPSTSEAARQLAHAENFDRAEFVNSVHLPIELGDLFASGNRRFVLVEQPCDLMVRKGGSRSPELHDAVLLELGDRPPRRLDLGFELPFYKGTGEPAWVHFGKQVNVPMRALDLTVFDTVGESRLDMTANPPSNLWPAWEERYRKLQGKCVAMKGYVTALDGLKDSKGVTEELHKALVERLLQMDSSSGRSISGKIDGNIISYKLRRVGRVRAALSKGLMLKYALHKARDAYDFPLAAGAN